MRGAEIAASLQPVAQRWEQRLLSLLPSHARCAAVADGLNRGLDRRREHRRLLFLRLLMARRVTYSIRAAPEVLRACLLALLAWGPPNRLDATFQAFRKSLQARLRSPHDLHLSSS